MNELHLLFNNNELIKFETDRDFLYLYIHHKDIYNGHSIWCIKDEHWGGGVDYRSDNRVIYRNRFIKSTI